MSQIDDSENLSAKVRFTHSIHQRSWCEGLSVAARNGALPTVGSGTKHADHRKTPQDPGAAI